MEKNYKLPGHLQSRCRRCGKTYMSYTQVLNVEEALTMIAFIGRTARLNDKDEFIMEKSLHDCADGGSGIGDCIGGLTLEDMVPEKKYL